MKTSTTFVAKAVPDLGWRIWNRKIKRWWGNYFQDYPQDVLDELNGQRRGDVLTELCKRSYGMKK